MLACVILMIISIIGFIIIIIILTWMGPLTYILDGEMVYGYSFLVDLDIPSPLMHSVFSFRNLHWIYASIYQFVVVWPQ